MNKRKKYFDTRREALKEQEARGGWSTSNSLFKLKYGRNKGKFFLGSEIEWLNLPG